MKTIIKNNFGFSMLQGMILASVVAGGSLVATRMLTDQKLAQKGSETRDLINELHNSVYTVLQNRNNCYETMVGNSLQATLTGSTSAHPMLLIKTFGSAAGDNFIDTTNAYMNNSVTVKSITLGAPTGGTRVLELVYERLDSTDPNARTKTGYGAKEIRKSIVLRIQKNPPGSPNAGQFTSCYATTADIGSMNGADSAEEGNINLAKQFCEEMNSSAPSHPAFIWDENNSICRPNTACPGSTIFAGIDSNGDVKCRNLAEWIDLDQIIDKTPSSGCGFGGKVQIQVDNVSKKARIICTP